MLKRGEEVNSLKIVAEGMGLDESRVCRNRWSKNGKNRKDVERT